MKIAHFTAIIALTLVLSACLKTHRIDIQQGNVITEAGVAQLEPGMTKREVRYILGTPLIVDPFHQNRWDYFYFFDRRGEKNIKRRITIIFEDDLMKTIEGDIGTNTEKSVVQEGEGTVITESQQEDEGFFKRTWGKIWPGGDE
jgi:outer membrane protein assembly factor BamE